ncbi:NPCBM/NEW2 domain-containing protein [Candidatus Soleaferrea massiliensis]|uniref:NPCBM/NEW2 domain-containing protein n=1 Tax=Candidatus Soleaferrea massiliensis TaxID=1470354 RepID=UPI00058D5030|nr:NPCBM/NEW2 domain-containing protein [Candidatus Soleaferrea massiliensis]
MKKTMKIVTGLSAVLLTACMLSSGVGAHDNGVAETPPMGWSSWNAFHANIDEELIKDTADAMIRHGLRDVGYEYVNLDDNWQSSERDVNDRLQNDPLRFPHGMKWLADYVHDRDLKIGLYTSNGLFTCQDLPASEFRELQDAASFAEWGIDYFKYDYCHNVQLSTTAYGIYGIKIGKPNTPGTEIYEYKAAAAQLEGTARLVGTSYIDGLGEDVGSATFTVTVPEDGAYALNLDFYKKPSGTEVPMFIDINGDSVHPYRMMLPATNATGGAPGSRGAAILQLKAGENTLRFYNPIRTSNRNYDTARYNYGIMRDNLMNAAERYAAEQETLTGIPTPVRPICFSICEWGGRQPWIWGGETGNLWRTTGDISASWSSVMSIYDVNVNLYRYAGRYDGAEHIGWNDPDMLEVGNGSLTRDENIAHFSLWCEMASPLILGNDLRLLDDREDILEIIKNEEAIAVNQDPKGIQGIKYQDDGDQEYLVKPLSGGRAALVMLNRAEEPAAMSVELSRLGEMVREKDAEYFERHFDLPKTYVYHVKDVWEKDADGKNIEKDAAALIDTVPSHGVKMYVIEPSENAQKGAYLLGNISKNKLMSGEKAVISAKFVNGGMLDVRTVGLKLNLPQGFTARPLTSTAGSGLALGDVLHAQWEITAPKTAVSSQPITISADLLYEDDGEITTLRFDTVVSVTSTEGLTPLPDGPLTIRNWVSGKAGWGTIRQDRSINGNRLTIAGTVYDTGIGTHAPSELVYYIGGRNVTFTALCGADDDSGSASCKHSYRVYGDDELLFDSGNMTWKQAAQSIEVNLIGHNFLRLVVDDLGNKNYDHADWIDPRIKAYEPAVVTEGPLTTRNWMYGNSYWNTIEDGKTIDRFDAVLTLGGVEYGGLDDGYGVNAPSVVAYYINGASGLFTAKIGIGDEIVNDGKTSGGTVVYQVWGDDVLLYETYMDRTTGIEDLSIPLAGYDVLKLVVGDNGDGTTYDHACWVQPRLVPSSEPLRKIIDRADALYSASVEGELDGQTPGSAREAFLAAIVKAQAVADDENATGIQLGAACSELQQAITEFEAAKIVVDKSGLAGAIMLGQLLDENDYAPGRWADFKAAFDAAVDVFARQDVSQAEADAAEADLREAVRKLNVVGGDVNADGVLDQRDLQMIKDYISGVISFTPEQFTLADYNGDGRVNVLDLLNWKLEITR